MSETHTTSWTNFSVGRLSTDPEWTNTDCTPLEHVYHITHVETAIAIAQQSQLQAGLVYDKSRLNQYRILVTWLSPNDWYRGSLYGNVRFHFDWKQLVKNKKYYWIGVMENYNPPAIRILITSKKYPAASLLQYDPKRGDGPWWHDETNDRHYWNGNYTLEFMLEDDISLQEATKVDFVDHHPNLCSLKQICPDKGTSSMKAASRFLAGYVSQLPKCTYFPWLDGSGGPKFLLEFTTTNLFSELKYGKDDSIYSGSITERTPQADAITRAYMVARYFRREGEAVTLQSLFYSRQDFLLSCRRVIENHLGLPVHALDSIFGTSW